MKTYTLFRDGQRLHTGDLRSTLTFLKTNDPASVLIFEDVSGRPADFDLRGTLDEVLERELPPAQPAPSAGRPKLGVVAREVTLLPRHWEWLEAQRGGASATLRRLIDEERKRSPEAERVWQAQVSADRFMSAMSDHLSNHEEASRALYARDGETFLALSQNWPADVRQHVLHLAAPAFGPQG